jgi:DNA mismatch repair protein MutS
LELKNIFNRANSNSIVLGDEIAHGTETLSAVAIVAAAIARLVEKGANFLFATHLHQLVELEEIKRLPGVVAKHLSVHYDGKKLVYDRKLKDGSGSTLYGLEFAKSIEMDPLFLQKAEQIRKKLARDYSELELLTRRKSSRYNRDLYIATCAICGKPVEEVHHIREKSKSDGRFIGPLPVNHKYNLLPLCKYHHQLVHQGRLIIKGFITTSEGIQLHWEELGEPAEGESVGGEGGQSE